jgi:hypothetical protein
MDTATIEPGPAGWRAIQSAAQAVGRALSREHGFHQFYPLGQVQRQIAAAVVDGAAQPWVYAMFVSHADFEAYFAVRETPGTYAQLRAAMSAPEARSVPAGLSGGDGLDDPVDLDDLVDLAWWLVQVAAEA